MDQTIRMNGKWIHGSDTFDARSKQERRYTQPSLFTGCSVTHVSTLVTPPAETIARPFTRLPSRRFKRHSQREEKEAAGTAPDSEPNTEQQRHASSWCFGYSGRPAGASASLSPFCLLSTR